MGEQRKQHHPALDDVVFLLGKANRDLSVVQHQLEKEFQSTFPDHANPIKLVSRIKKIQEDLVSLKDLCRELLAEKQDLIDKARASLVGQRSSLQRLLASTGLSPISDSDDLVYTNLNQIIDEWTTQVGIKAGEEKDSEAINHMLFSAIVSNN